MKRFKTLFLLIAFLCISAFAKGNSYNIVFIGNSITYGDTQKDHKHTAPPVATAEWLQKQSGVDSVYFVNMGKNGKRSWDFLPDYPKTFFDELVDKTNMLIKDHPQDHLIFSIMLGTNDSARRPMNDRTPANQYSKNITALLDTLYALYPEAKVIIHRSVWYSPNTLTKNGSVFDTSSDSILQSYWKSMPDLVRRMEPDHLGALYLGDSKAYNYFKANYHTDMTPQPGGNGTFYLHPNEKGAKVLGEFWGKAIYEKIIAPALVDHSKDPLCGKKVGVIGDSYVRNHRQPIDYTWHYKWAMKHGMKYYNYGRNGNCVSVDLKEWGPAMIHRYQNMADSLDWIIIIAGHNDAARLKDIGAKNYAKAVKMLCKGLKKKYPEARICWFTPWINAVPEFKIVVDITKRVCAKYDIPVFDAYHDGTIKGLDDSFRARYFQGKNDHAHLNARGHDLFLPVAEEFLSKL